MRLIIKLLYVVTAVALLGDHTQAREVATITEPYEAPTGLGLLLRNLVNGHPKFYGAMSPQANWHFSQWGAPGDLPGLTQTGADWSSAAAWANIDVSRNGNLLVENIAQDGGILPCKTPQGQPNEFDLFVEPNDGQETAPNATNPRYGSSRKFPNLAQLASFTVSGLLEVIAAGPGHGTNVCQVNHAGAGYSITLVDDKVIPHQLFWYSLQMANICLHGSGADDDFQNCSRAARHPSAWWYWTGSRPPGKQVSTDAAGRVTAVNFAIGDVMSSFNQSLATPGIPKTISIDFLPRLTDLIRSGNYGIDSNLSNWRLGQITFGQALWGNTMISTSWHDFAAKWKERSKEGAAH